jgi:prepilin-type N-terminal cleavage/methylation domain-containing protein
MRNYTRYTGQRSQGFTLVELLVVIALTVILLSVLFVPLIQAFHFTEQAQAETQAQDGARLTTEQLSRELGNAAAVRDTTGNYLDLPLVNKAGAQIVAHAYNAYIDIVPPRSQAGGTDSIVDPTVDPANPTQLLNKPGVVEELTAPGVGLPIAAGSTVIRWFVGLRYPINPKYVPVTTTPDAYIASGAGTYAAPADPQPYLNPYDQIRVTSTDAHFTSYVRENSLANTYQLYRVNFQPYIFDSSTGKYKINNNLFAIQKAADGTQTPVLDDPDFFRIVTTGEPGDYVSYVINGSTGAIPAYTAKAAQDHNDRVYYWSLLAKEVIATHDIDLVGLPRTGGKVVFDSLKGNPVDSYEADGTPIVRTSVNFAPALISNDPMAASNTSNSSQGYGESPSTTSLPYVPTLYQAQYGNWQGTPTITITKSSNGTLSYMQTRTYTSTDATSNYTLGVPNYSSPSVSAPAVGDAILAQVTTAAPSGPGTPVYDITAGAPILTAAAATAPTYDALILDKSRGVVSFAIPALPLLPTGQTATTPPNTYFTVTGPFNQYNTSGQTNIINLGDYALLPGTPLAPPSNESPAGTNPNQVPNATVVINSERVVGPDMASGIQGSAPSTDLVQYTRVSAGEPSAPNTYSINYATNAITLDPNALPASVQIAFSYQNNLSTGSADTVDNIRASYYTAAVVRLNLGVRVYAAATGYSEYFTLNSQVGVGNSKAN